MSDDTPIMENRILDTKEYLRTCTDEQYQQFVFDFVKNKENDGVYMYEILKYMQELGRG